MMPRRLAMLVLVVSCVSAWSDCPEGAVAGGGTTHNAPIGGGSGPTAYPAAQTTADAGSGRVALSPRCRRSDAGASPGELVRLVIPPGANVSFTVDLSAAAACGCAAALKLMALAGNRGRSGLAPAAAATMLASSVFASVAQAGCEDSVYCDAACGCPEVTLMEANAFSFASVLHIPSGAFPHFLFFASEVLSLPVK
jgi:hypothetical protein